MLRTEKAEIMGMKKFVGNVDGKSYDTTKIFVKVNLDDSSGNAFGYATQEFNAGTSEVYEKYKNIPLPADFDIDMQLVSTGKAMKQIVKAIRPSQPKNK